MKVVKHLEFIETDIGSFMNTRDEINEILCKRKKNLMESFQILSSLMTDMCIYEGVKIDKFLALLDVISHGYEEKQEYLTQLTRSKRKGRKVPINQKDEKNHDDLHR